MKKYFFPVMLVVIIGVIHIAGLYILFFAGGKIKDAELIIGDSDIYSGEEIEGAMQVVLDHFHSSRSFYDCELLELCYDEDDDYIQGEIERCSERERYRDSDIIIVVSKFYVGSSASTEWNLDTTYSGFQWILTRSDGEEAWAISDSGY